ncbi:hypothetical protein V1523DRAFT_346072 [Lipomyces doorenjongii]
MPGERELFPDHLRTFSPAGTGNRAPAPLPAPSSKQVSASLHDILAQSLHDLNIESTNHDRDQTRNISSLTSTAPATVSQQAAVPVPRINTSRVPPNHHPSLSALRQPHSFPRSLFTPQPVPPLSHDVEYSSTAPIEVASYYHPSRYPSHSTTSPLSAMHYPPHYSTQYPQSFTRTSSITSTSSNSGSSVRSPMSSPPISSTSSSSFASSSPATSCERDLFPQATQLDLRIPMLPDPSPLSDPSFFFSNDQGFKDNSTDDQHHARRSKQRKRHTHSRTPIEQVGVPASAATPAGLMSSVGTPADTPLPVRVQFREEMLCGDGGCIDDDDDDDFNDHEVLDERPSPAQRESKSSVTSIRESEYDADEDDVSDAPDEGVFVRGRTPSTWYEQPVKQVRPLDDPGISRVRGTSFPDMSLDDG